jgi:hypothetical protein
MGLLMVPFRLGCAAPTPQFCKTHLLLLCTADGKYWHLHTPPPPISGASTRQIVALFAFCAKKCADFGTEFMIFPGKRESFLKNPLHNFPSCARLCISESTAAPDLEGFCLSWALFPAFLYAKIKRVGAPFF